MTTIDELVVAIGDDLAGYTHIRPQVTYLTAPITATDTTIQVAHGTRVSIGLIEIDDELLLVENVEGNTVRVFPFGRGQSASVAATHDANTRVTNDPPYPRVKILDAVKEAVKEISLILFQVKTAELIWHPVHVTYELPADVDRVLRVTHDMPGPWRTWREIKNWRLNTDASVDEFPSGKSIDIRGNVVTGYTVQVTYAAPYVVPTSTADDFADLGIQESVRDVILYNALWRLTQPGENARLQLQSAEQASRQEYIQPGAITNAAKQYYAMYAQRLDEERRRLLTLNPQTAHFTR